MAEHPSTVALIVAAGRGRRLGAETAKQYLQLGGSTVLRHSVAAFLRHPGIQAVRVVIHPDDRQDYDAALRGLELLDPVGGGAERQDSVRLGLESLEPLAPRQVLIHDAARPFVSQGLISRVLAALENHAAVLPGLALSDTLKRVEGKRIAGTQDRSGLIRAQTPQGFGFAEILAAHRAAEGLALTDDAAVAEAAGLEVLLVAGEAANEKITSIEDLQAAKLRFAAGRETRSGQGFDVHRFGEGDAITLCGIEIPHEKSLLGHSDADVALHALTDAILGTLGAGDIGSHFPPSDPQWRGAASRVFLEHAAELAAARGGEILHLDLTIICEAPKIGPHRERMRENVASLLGLDLDRVSIKATTTEGLGFTGRGEGIAVQALATLSLPKATG